MYLDFTTLYSQPSEHYERILQPPTPLPPKKPKTKKKQTTTTTIEEVLRAILKSKRRITLLEIIF